MLTSPRRRCWKLTVRVTCSNLLISLSVPSHAIVSIVIDSVPPAGISLQEVQHQYQFSWLFVIHFLQLLLKEFALWSPNLSSLKIKFCKLYCFDKNTKPRTSWLGHKDITHCCVWLDGPWQVLCGATFFHVFALFTMAPASNLPKPNLWLKW